jgi:hypothetical protein
MQKNLMKWIVKEEAYKMPMVKRGNAKTGRIVEASDKGPKPCAGCGKVLPTTALCASGLCSDCRKK